MIGKSFYNQLNTNAIEVAAGNSDNGFMCIHNQLSVQNYQVNLKFDVANETRHCTAGLTKIFYRNPELFYRMS